LRKGKSNSVTVYLNPDKVSELKLLTYLENYPGSASGLFKQLLTNHISGNNDKVLPVSDTPPAVEEVVTETTIEAVVDNDTAPKNKAFEIKSPEIKQQIKAVSF
jgi:hypothetical protein